MGVSSKSSVRLQEVAQGGEIHSNYQLSGPIYATLGQYAITPSYAIAPK